MKIIFFDGVCGLCNGFVDFILKIDKHQSFTFSPLQSEYAAQHLEPEHIKDLTSVVYLKNGKKFLKSRAVIEILSDIGGIWKLAVIGKVIPDNLRNKAYDMVAANRYKLFGKKETCRLPTPEERARFLT